jgi:hypothetical protein
MKQSPNFSITVALLLLCSHIKAQDGPIFLWKATEVVAGETYNITYKTVTTDPPVGISLWKGPPSLLAFKGPLAGMCGVNPGCYADIS